MSHALHRRTALALGAAATILYLVTAPAIPNLDGLGYLKLLPHNFAAGHLLFMPALRALSRLVGDGLRAGRLYDALLGGTGVVLTYSIARRLLAAWDDDAARLGAAFAAAGLALSYGYWSEANDVEAYAAAMVALLATVRMALSFAPHPSLARAAATGALLGVAVLSHLSHVLLSGFVAYYLWQHARGRRPMTRIVPPLVALATGGALSIALYAYAALVVRHHDLHGALAWIATAQHGFVTAGGAYRLADAVYGLCKAIVWSPYLYEADAQKLVGQLLLGLVPLGALFVGAVSAWGRRARERLDLAALAWWTAPYALLGVAFFGADPERWIFVLPAGWILAAALLLELGRPTRAALAVLLWVGAFNFVTAVWPAHRDQWPRQKAELTASQLRDGDLLIFPGHSWDEYVVFYGAPKIEPFPVSYYAARDGVPAAWARLDKEIAEARARGGRVFCVRVFDDADQDPRGFWELGTVGVSRAALKDALVQRGRPVTIAPAEGLTVTRLEP
ncbi:MAG TPA: glycosyltransferase family 39 protein [Polyangia bacterium]